MARHRIFLQRCKGQSQVSWLQSVARTPGSLQVVVQSVTEIRQAQIVSETRGPVQRALQELCDLGWHQAESSWVWHVRGSSERVDMTMMDPNEFKHILRDSIRR